MSLPVGWPAASEVETLPTVWLALDAMAWPPAADGRAPGVVPVSSWQVERELVGSALPGNIRARSGLSVGTASAEIAQVAKGLTPWALAASRRVITGAKADLYASHDGWASAARVDFGDWRVAPTSGALGSAGVSVELVERQYRGRVQEHRMPPPDMPLTGSETDPAWIIDRLARQMGYYLTPPPAPSTLISFPLTGSGTTELPNVQGLSVMEVPAWGNDLGMVSPETGDWYVQEYHEHTVPVVGGVQTCYVTMNVVGQVVVLLGEAHALRFDADAHTVSVSNDFYGGPAWVARSYTPGLDANHPNRVQVEVARTLSGSTWTACTIRVRSAADAAWSATATSSASEPVDPAEDAVTIISGNGLTEVGSATGFQLSLAADPELWTASERPISLPSLGGIIDAPFVGADTDVWSAIQDVCAAWMAACIVSTDGALRVLTRDDLNGFRVDVATVDVGSSFEDLPWSLDPADVADRLELTFTPPAFQNYESGEWPPVLWQSEEVIEVAPHSTITIKATLSRAGSALLGWFPAWGTPTTKNTWSAFTTADASGTHVDIDALAFKTTPISSSLVEIAVTNTLNDKVYLIDASGSPCLILRAARVASFETQQVVARGAQVADADNPVTVDLGYYVQHAEDAEELADYLWSRVSTPMWKASSVRVRLDWEHDIGRVLRLQHDRSDLDAKALVTKVSWSGSPGEIQQTLDLVLLPVTWADFDEAWASGTWADFNETWASKSWADFDYYPTEVT